MQPSLHVMLGFNDLVIEKMNETFDFESADEFTDFALETACYVQTKLAKKAHDQKGGNYKSNN